MNSVTSKRACVISADALWLLIAAGRSMQLVPGLSPAEYARLTEAIAAAHRSLGDVAPRERPVPALREFRVEWDEDVA